MTNGDKIRAMTDEEIAKFIVYASVNCPPGYICEPGDGLDCTDCWIPWFKEEAKDDV